MDSASDSHTEQVFELAKDYLARCRAGKRPALSEYTSAYPKLAEKIREVLPMMELMESVARDSSIASETRLEQLGDFRIHRIIGRGGMGTVYEATQLSLGRRVALKVCPLAGSAQQRERFRRESRSAAMLHHSNIVPVFAVGETSGFLYYAMQYIRGASLDDVIGRLQQLWRKSPSATTCLRDTEVPLGTSRASQVAESLTRDGPSHEGLSAVASVTSARVSLPGQTSGGANSNSLMCYWQSVAQIGLQVADALAYAHGRDTLHRDIKPGNLILDESGTVWVMDFGLAKLLDEDDLTRDGELIGTLRYMAPEQVAGNPSPRSDVYSLGLTLYELLTLRPAFEELNRSALLRAVATRDPVQPRKLNSQIPRDLETIVLKSIEREPSRRYSSARELAEDLQRFLAGEPIRARRITPIERIRKWAHRRPLVAGLSLALALLFCAAFLLVSWQWREAVLARRESEARAVEAVQAATAEKNARDEAERQKVRAEALLDRAEQAWYRSGISRVEAISRTAPNLAAELLESLSPAPTESDRRGWEWGYLRELGRQSHLILQCGAPDAEWIRALEFSPDETLLAVGACRTGFVRPVDQSPTGRVSLWEIRQGRKLQEFPIKDSGWSLAISSDNRRIAICEAEAKHFDLRSWTGPTWIWDVNTAERIVPLEQPGMFWRPDEEASRQVWRTTDLTFFDQDRRILGTVWSRSRYPAGICIWDAMTGEILWHRSLAEVIRLDEPKRQLIVADYNQDDHRVLRLEIEDQREFEVLGALPRDNMLPGQEFVVGMQLPNARNRPYIDDLATRRRLLLWGDDRYRACETQLGRPVVDLLLEKNAIAVGATDGTVRIWDTGSGELRRILHGHAIDVQAVAYSPTGRWLATGDWHGEVRVWLPDVYANRVDCRPLGKNPSGCLLEDISFRFGGSNLVGYGFIYDRGVYGDAHRRGHLTVWEPNSGIRLNDIWTPAARIADRQRTAAFSPTGELLATIDRQHRLEVTRYESATRLLEQQWPSWSLNQVALGGAAAELVATSQTAEAEPDPALSSPVSASQSQFQSEAGRGLPDRVVVQRVEGGEVLHEFSAAVADRIALGRSSNLLAVAYADTPDRPASLLQLHDLDRNRAYQLPTAADIQNADSRVSAIEFSNDDRQLAVAWADGLLGIYKRSSDGTFEVAFYPAPEGIADLAWHPAGNRVAGANREFVTLWDDQGRNLLELRGRPRFGDLPFDPSIAFSADGVRLAATQWDNSVRVWSSDRGPLPKGQREARLPRPSPEAEVRIAPEAYSVAAMQQTIEKVPDDPWYIAARGQLGSSVRARSVTRQDYLAAKRLLAGDDPCLLMHGKAYVESSSLPLHQCNGHTFEAWIKHWNYQQPGGVYGVVAAQYPEVPREYFALQRFANQLLFDGFGEYWLRPTAAYSNHQSNWCHLAVCFHADHRTYFLNGQQIGQSRRPLKFSEEMGPFLVATTSLHNPQIKGRGLLRSLRVSDGILYESEGFEPQEELRSEPNTMLLYDFTLDDGFNTTQPTFIEDRSGHERHGELRHAWWLESGPR